MKKRVAGALLVIVSLIGLATFLILDSWRDQDQEGFVRPEEGGLVPRVLDVGEEGFVSSGNGKETIIAATKEALDEIVKAELANDNTALAQMVSVGRAFRVADMTRIILIDSDDSMQKVRILEGDAVGHSGWLPREWVKRQGEIK